MEDKTTVKTPLIWCIIIMIVAITILWKQKCTAYDGGMSISTMGTASYISSNKGNDWELTSSNDSYFTVFEYDSQYKFYKHTAEDIVSMYLIKSGTLNLDTATMCMTYQCQSDVGNNYTCCVFLNATKDRRAMIVNTWYDGDAKYMVVWYIKSYWINEEKE